ncbi:EAL domain, c-di-GMP-specific phosphodiesterase class I (or its enzymatically inactive variant) [Oceanospirillum multiglobuliferum]|uniref:Diguanylate phosphodiesterase n=2 Tax=Oceanospirillum multiglobuliferum TaxID=64969 RepID=A0A1T4NNF8_9GAMM|nr:diguanylate phosphodiesterase [Oceanospirillum multiglobuliferum]SJZ80840.1 EAL domain, c-di-GMP-specific phosphodiesterase class I (or its enzymatically inactive variant) [Oceanospirillum multiglobuliferum]
MTKVDLCDDIQGCDNCRDKAPLSFTFSFAFQPIVSAKNKKIVSYEALVRGVNGEPANSVFANVNNDNLYQFDQACRVTAIKKAVELGLDTYLNLNFTPNAVYKPELCIRTTLEAAKQYGFPVEKIVFEVVEGEEVKDKQHLVNIINAYKKMGFKTAIDDFGAGYSGLNLLADYEPNIIKLDRDLIVDIHQHRRRQAIIRGIILVCKELNLELLAEGVELKEEYEWLVGQGIDLFQGYYFARPAFEQLVSVDPALF